MKTLIASVCLLAFAMASTTALAAQAYKITAGESAAVRDGLKRSLKDPDSAKVGRVIAVKDPKGVRTVCGFVNAKNSYGGYGGDMPFLGILATNTLGKTVFIVNGIGSPADGGAVIRQVCAESGIALN